MVVAVYYKSRKEQYYTLVGTITPPVVVTEVTEKKTAGISYHILSTDL